MLGGIYSQGKHWPSDYRGWVVSRGQEKEKRKKIGELLTPPNSATKRILKIYNLVVCILIQFGGISSHLKILKGDITEGPEYFYLKHILVISIESATSTLEDWQHRGGCCWGSVEIERSQSRIRPLITLKFRRVKHHTESRLEWSFRQVQWCRRWFETLKSPLYRYFHSIARYFVDPKVNEWESLCLCVYAEADRSIKIEGRKTDRDR